ncbi:hypothetical protein Bhyg_07603, partial [Pseudolycoriella hygida]
AFLVLVLTLVPKDWLATKGKLNKNRILTDTLHEQRRNKRKLTKGHCYGVGICVYCHHNMKIQSVTRTDVHTGNGATSSSGELFCGDNIEYVVGSPVTKIKVKDTKRKKNQKAT